jgi:hypothetical protein
MNDLQKLNARASAPLPLAACIAFALTAAGLALPNAVARTSSDASIAVHARQAARHHGPASWAARAQRRSDQAARSAQPHDPQGTLPVTSCEDDGSAGTLRSVVSGAVTGDTVDLSALTCSTITLTQGAIFVYVDDLALHGPPDGLTISGSDLDSVLVGYGYGTLSIDHLAITHGRYDGSGSYANGGCIFTTGNVNLDHAAVSDCSAGNSVVFGKGAGIFADGSVSTTSSTLADSIASAAGGAVYGYGDVSITDTTISGNSAAIGDAGGIWSNGSADISNSTISGNSAPAANGGGVFVLGALRVHNSTIAFNSSAYGGSGVFVARSYGPDMQSSIIADNVVTGIENFAADIGSSYTVDITGSNNLIVTSDLPVPGDTLSDDPQLMPLADNGGPTETHALAPTSPAIDAGNNDDGLLYDQRGDGYPREIGAAADIGAFEMQPIVDTIFQNGFELPGAAF